MNCPHCNEELEFDSDFYNSEIELNTDEVEGTVTFALICESCDESLGEYDFALDQSITDFWNLHESEEEDHELSAELSNETFIETLHNNVPYLGAEATITINCICGAQTEYLWSISKPATEIMEELGS